MGAIVTQQTTKGVNHVRQTDSQVTQYPQAVRQNTPTLPRDGKTGEDQREADREANQTRTNKQITPAC